MIEDLDMTGHDYNIALFVFFIPYILFEVPSNIIIKKLAPSTWLSVIMVLWGKLSSGNMLRRTSSDGRADKCGVRNRDNRTRTRNERRRFDRMQIPSRPLRGWGFPW